MNINVLMLLMGFRNKQRLTIQNVK